MNFTTELLAGIDSAQAGYYSKIITDINVLSNTVKKRIVYPQTEEMEKLQRRLKSWLRTLIRNQAIVSLKHATATMPGDSVYAHVKRHRRRDEHGRYYFGRYFYVVDLKDAYAHVDPTVLATLLCMLSPELIGKEQEVVLFLSRFCFHPEGGLVTGASASPDLFNLYISWSIDEHLSLLTMQPGIIYTRYLDDLVFSSNYPFSLEQRRVVRNTIKESGMMVNDRKVRIIDLQKGATYLNGIGISITGDMFVPRRFLTSLRGMLYKFLSGKGLDISPVMVRGKVSVFLHTLAENARMPNKTEEKVLKLCHHFLARQKDARDQARRTKRKPVGPQPVPCEIDQPF